ncbi:GlcG/HbpS family heme-binding protein [Suipraeoptans intestinalis]|uniref:Heme-binding protein n=1 Tax=Suipraeoptans intestinalis TaxID=2606628 RepID=A0A6N7URW2_9FIRM|nr:heme-binding protein [Suipraeoptans intestinalis]MDD7769940.1 heme-binding protein [Suipraeoptans intestinalis]MDY3122582.1 heme-binding protein [Suipraeoptans intestinalis]MSR93511.1 heme-binding protein [Suipraeoptans intestinalis]
MKEERVARLVKAAWGGSRDKRLGMTLELAAALVECVEDRAEELGLAIVSAVSDASGHPILVRSMDGAYRGSYDVAVNKTYTAVAFQRSTSELGKAAQPGQSLYGIQFTNHGRIVLFGGGEILQENGKIIGALGISGGSAEQDEGLAVYGKKLLEEVVSCR